MHAHLVQIEIHEMTNHFVITVVQASIDCITIEALGRGWSVLGLELDGGGGGDPREGACLRVCAGNWREFETKQQC